jgi:hypothetical protein
MSALLGYPEIAKDAAGRWHIRDFGRGLSYRAPDPE